MERRFSARRHVIGSAMLDRLGIYALDFTTCLVALWQFGIYVYVNARLLDCLLFVVWYNYTATSPAHPYCLNGRESRRESLKQVSKSIYLLICMGLCQRSSV